MADTRSSKFLRCAALLVLLAALCPLVWADGTDGVGGDSFGAPVKNTWAVDSLPRGYSTVQLGMSVDETKTALFQDISFGYRGDRDVSLLPGENRTLIETVGVGALKNCWFQFQNGTLFTITLTMNPEVMDFYSLFSTLCDKYGSPQSLSPKVCVWQSDETILNLERPLTLKYIDAGTAGQLAATSKTQAAGIEVLRAEFLDAL